MRPPHAFSLLGAVVTLVCVLWPTPAFTADAIERDPPSLRGTVSLDEFESEDAFIAFPLILNLNLIGDFWMTASNTEDGGFSIWEKGEALDKARPRAKRFQLFDSNRGSIELWGARIYKSEIRFDLGAEMTPFGDTSAIAIAWGKGSVSGMYEVLLTEDVRLRAKVAFARESQRDLTKEVNPLKPEVETQILAELHWKLN